MAGSEPAVVVEDLTKQFGTFTAVDRISFTVSPGEIFGFLGPNGSGKTTTIRMMLGLMKPTKGGVRVLGLDVDGDTRSIRPRVGYMSQRFSLYNDLSVIQNLRFHGTAYGLHGPVLKARIEGALAAAGLEGQADARTGQLSGGWRQRLALGAAILHQPELVFLDEPTAGVDPLSRRAFWDLLYSLSSQGVTVFVTTHYMDEAEHCHRLAFIQNGRIIASGSPEAVKSQTMRGEVLEIESSDPPRAVQLLRAAPPANLPIAEVELYGALIHVVAPDIRSLQPAIEKYLQQAGVKTLKMSVIEPSLEDVFIAAMQAG